MPPLHFPNHNALASSEEREGLLEALTAATEGAPRPALAGFAAIDYFACRDDDVLAIVPKEVGRGRAVMALHPNSRRELVVGAPHPHIEFYKREGGPPLLQGHPQRGRKG